MMDVLDVNVLVNAYRQDAPDHHKFADYLRSLCDGTQPFAVPSVVLSGFLRIVTHPGIFAPPSPFDDALVFVERLLLQSHCLKIEPGDSHWSVFIQLCIAGGARGNLISDAYLAAIVMEKGGELVTADRGFGRWPGLRWRHP